MKRFALATCCIAVLATTASANLIPWPPPAKMPFEEMRIGIDRVGGVYRATFAGQFTFDYIPDTVASMQFPMPLGATDIAVGGPPGVPRSWMWSQDTYPTILPEMPSLPMVKWDGPFPVNGEIFTVEYEHDLIERPGEYVFFYSLGTGKYFPTYHTSTTAQFEMSLPADLIVETVCLDETVVDPNTYQVEGCLMTMTLDSGSGPFTKDLIITLVPEPATIALLALGGLAVLRRARRKAQWRGGSLTARHSSTRSWPRLQPG